MADLSVVVPGYNALAHLTPLLGSLRQNASDDIEFLFVDDASTDGTAEAVEQALPQVPGLRLVRSAANVGLASARNLGLDEASGRWVTFVDADDWLGRGYLPRLLDVARTSGVDALRVDHVQVRGLRRTVHRAPVARRGRVLRAVDHVLPAHETTMVDYPYAWAGVLDRERVPDALLRFDAGLRTAEDRPWIWRLHLGLETFLVPDLLGYFYRREVSASLTQTVDERQLDFVRAFSLVLQEVDGSTARLGAERAAALRAKALRTFSAVLAHHLGRSSLMGSDVRRRLLTTSRTLLQQVPSSELDAVLAGMDDDRAAAVRSVLEPDLRRRGRLLRAV